MGENLASEFGGLAETERIWYKAVPLIPGPGWRLKVRRPVRRKGFGLRLGPRILRVGGSDPPPTLWGEARRAQLPAHGSTPSWAIRAQHKLSQFHPPAVSYPPPPFPRAPPGPELERRARPGRGLGQSPVDPEWSRPPRECPEPVESPRPAAAQAGPPP